MTLIKLLVILLVALGALFYFTQRSILFPAPPAGLPKHLPEGVEHLALEEGYALLLKPLTSETQPSPLLIFAHGNGEAAFWWMDQLDEMRAAGFRILLLEYPGYAGAPGRPSLSSIKRSALAAFDKAVARPEVDASRVVVYGRSIGGGAAGLIASERPIAALGLESTFSTLSKLAAEKRMPYFLLRDRFDNESVVKNISVPVFFYHGIHDDLIPIHHSKRLVSLAKVHKFIPASCGHNNCPPAWTRLLEFLSSHNIIDDNALL